MESLFFSRNLQTQELKYSQKEMKKKLRGCIQEVKEELYAAIEEKAGILETYFLLAKGMNTIGHGIYWSYWKETGAVENQMVLEGVLSKDEVIKRLMFVSLPKDYAKGIKNWVESLDNGQLKCLVKFMRGSTSLLGKKPLQFKGNEDGVQITFPHTCFSRVDISTHENFVLNKLLTS